VSCTVRLRVSHPLQLIDGASPGADLCRRYPSSTAAPAGVLVATFLTAGQFVATELDSTVRDINSAAGDVDLATPDLDYAAEEGGLDELAPGGAALPPLLRLRYEPPGSSLWQWR